MITAKRLLLSIFAALLGTVYCVSQQRSWVQVADFSTGPIHVLTADCQGNLFAGTDIGGVYSSSNGGASWNQINNGLALPYVRSLTIDSVGGVFAGTQGAGVFRSTDQGQHWHSVSVPTRWTIRALAASSGGVILAGTSGDGIYRSTNGGINWHRADPGLPDLFVRSIAATASDTLFAGTAFAGVCRSTNRGESWTPTSLQGDGDFRSLVVIGSQRVFAGSWGFGIYRTTNGGSVWQSTSDGISNLVVESLASRDPTELLAATRGGGVFVSTNDGAVWCASNRGLTDLDVRSLIVGARGSVFAGTSSGKIFRLGGMSLVTLQGDTHSAQAYLRQNVPNPFNPTTTIRFVLDAEQVVRLTLHDLLGREVALLLHDRLPRGEHSFPFSGALLSSGSYLVTLRCRGERHTMKIVKCK